MAQGSFEAEPEDFIQWLQKGFESSGGKVVHDGEGVSLYILYWGTVRNFYKMP
jgi:hypothetical protein